MYCRIANDIYEGRNFNHLDPAMEDCATGVAAGALTAWLGRDLTVLQGHTLGNPCRTVTTVDGNNIDVGGATEFVVRCARFLYMMRVLKLQSTH